MMIAILMFVTLAHAQNSASTSDLSVFDCTLNGVVSTKKWTKLMVMYEPEGLVESKRTFNKEKISILAESAKSAVALVMAPFVTSRILDSEVTQVDTSQLKVSCEAVSKP